MRPEVDLLVGSIHISTLHGAMRSCTSTGSPATFRGTSSVFPGIHCLQAVLRVGPQQCTIHTPAVFMSVVRP